MKKIIFLFTFILILIEIAMPKQLGYWEEIFESTAYSYSSGSVTAMGTKVCYGTVAVDPSVIPLGSKVWVEGYGEGKALDTGGAINGYVIDVWFPFEEDCWKWGRKKVKVRIYY